MTPLSAAAMLEEEFRKFPWFLSVGVGRLADGRDALFVYVKSTRHEQLKVAEVGWMGYPVLVRKTGPIRSLSRFQMAVS